MKKLIFLLIATVLFSCKAYQSISTITEQVSIGMHVDDFKRIAKGRYQTDAMNVQFYVYRINQYDLNGILIDSMFYYFSQETNLLIEVNGGTRN